MDSEATLWIAGAPLLPVVRSPTAIPHSVWAVAATRSSCPLRLSTMSQPRSTPTHSRPISLSIHRPVNTRYQWPPLSAFPHLRTMRLQAGLTPLLNTKQRLFHPATSRTVHRPTAPRQLRLAMPRSLLLFNCADRHSGGGCLDPFAAFGIKSEVSLWHRERGHGFSGPRHDHDRIGPSSLRLH